MEVDQDDSDDSTDEVVSSEITYYPCCICETILCTPKELGTHILQKHCEQTESNKIG